MDAGCGFCEKPGAKTRTFTLDLSFWLLTLLGLDAALSGLALLVEGVLSRTSEKRVVK